MFEFIIRKIWNSLLPYLEKYLPNIINNQLEIRLEKIKSQLKQEEQKMK